MSRWVVVVEAPVDGLPRVFGTYSDFDRAEDYVARVNAKLMAAEIAAREAEDASSTGRDDYGRFEPPSEISYGRAYTRLLRDPRIRDAVEYAKGEPA